MLDPYPTLIESLASPTNLLQILIVEDSELDTELLLAALQRAGIGFQSQVADSLGSCRWHLNHTAYDVVLSDYRLPGFTTHQVMEVLRQSQINANTPLILVTGTLGEEAAVECIKSGVADYVLKDNLLRLPLVLSRSLREAELYRQQQASIQQIHHQAQQQTMINRIVQAMRETLVLEDVLQTTVNALHQALQVDRCLIFRPDGQHCMQACHVSEATTNHSSLLGIYCDFYRVLANQLQYGEPIVIDQFNDQISPDLQAIARCCQIQSLLIMPLRHQGQYLGGISLLQTDRARDWTAEDVELVRAIADHCAIAIYNAQSYERLEQLVQERTQELAAEKQLSDAANRAKSEFLAHMSHELRTPLTGILGFTSVLQKQVFGDLNAKQLQYLEGIASCGQHLLDLINDLLDLSKVEAGQEELFLEPVVVQEICDASLNLVRELANSQDLAIVLDIAPDITFCYGDKRRLKQILVNLLSNAIKFTDTGTISLSVQQDNEQIYFRVRDTGIGISQEDQAKLFHAFQQLDSGLSRKYQGTGLGLALAKKLAQLHDGDIHVQSQVGVGSTFTVTLPHPPVIDGYEAISVESTSKGSSVR
jgi:signal transduction histidine kinase/DNA-binding response OmpR family regulator